MKQQQRRTRYYIPGIISLTLLPAAFYFFAKKEIRQSTTWTMSIVWADTAYMSKQNIILSKYNGSIAPKRNYTDIFFTGDQQNDKTKLRFAEIRIKEILEAGDTLNGLHFAFGESSTYGTFVRTLDKLRIEGAKTYMPFENNLWFYHFQPDTTVKLIAYDCILCDDVISVKPKISWWTRAKKASVHIWQSSWQIIVLYCLFAISVVVLRRKNNGS